MDCPAAKTMAEIMPLRLDLEIFPRIFGILQGYQYPTTGHDHARLSIQQEIARIKAYLPCLLSAKAEQGKSLRRTIPGFLFARQFGVQRLALMFVGGLPQDS